jgi:hypothetical protein
MDYAEVRAELFRRFILRQAEQPCCKLYNVAVFGAAEAVKMVVVQLHRRISVLVENARGHTIAYAHTVIFCGRGNADGFFDFPEDVPVWISHRKFLLKM